MTAEDRAALVVQKWCEREWDAKAGVESIAAAIREAENEALDRALAEIVAAAKRIDEALGRMPK